MYLLSGIIIVFADAGGKLRYLEPKDIIRAMIWPVFLWANATC